MKRYWPPSGGSTARCDGRGSSSSASSLSAFDSSEPHSVLDGEASLPAARASAAHERTARAAAEEREGRTLGSQGCTGVTGDDTPARRPPYGGGSPRSSPDGRPAS